MVPVAAIVAPASTPLSTTAIGFDRLPAAIRDAIFDGRDITTEGPLLRESSSGWIITVKSQRMAHPVDADPEIAERSPGGRSARPVHRVTLVLAAPA
jgi:hypothetical protein